MPITAQNVKSCLKGSLLTLLTVTGVILGVVLGLILRSVKDDWTPREIMYIKFLGALFLRTLKALILPLIVSSLIAAVGSLDISMSKKIGIRAMVYYMITTCCAVTLGIIMVAIFGPGRGVKLQGAKSCEGHDQGHTVDNLMDIIRNLFPPNLVEATMALTQTREIRNDSISRDDWPLETNMVPGMNMMGLVCFSAVLGITLGNMRERGKPLLSLFVSLSEAMMLITSMCIWFSPIAILTLVAGQLVEQDDIAGIFRNIGWYFATVLTGLLLHGFVVVPTLFFLATRTLPFKFIMGMTQAIGVAFGTASSSATLPVTINCLENNNNVDQRVSRFVLPIGATINMDGTALYLPVGAMYIAQLCGRSLGLGDIISISLLSITTSIGAAGIPQIGMVLMLTVLNAVGLPGDYIPYIMPVDWLLERFRTAVNIMGDSYGAGIVHHLSKNELAKMPQTIRKNSMMPEPVEKLEENDIQL